MRSCFKQKGIAWVFAWSSGGALLTSLLKDRPAFLRFVIAFYALFDVQQYASAGNTEALEQLRTFSAIAALPQDASTLMPMLIGRAGRDEIPTLNDALYRFVVKALAANATVTVVNHPTGIHGFDNQNDDERSREIIRNAIEFMKNHLCLE
jgi:acetyl esterase/lipase